ncbi:hypothetical protein I552_5368 [Mycobacterium xenopi 3993]|nr:hypothetical protein I552_5368 [Mycobacterium xenopi 3993]
MFGQPVNPSESVRRFGPSTSDSDGLTGSDGLPAGNRHKVLDDGRIDCIHCGPVVVCQHTMHTAAANDG